MIMARSIYLDHAATSPLRSEARAAMADGFALWANPSSPHAAGRKARAALEEARERVAEALKWDGEVIFTSGASEAAMIAMRRAAATERFVSGTEHDAVLAAVPGAPRLAIKRDGALDEEALAGVLERTTRAVVAIQTINSETGNAQDLGNLIDCVHEANGLVVVDAAQSAGKYPLPHEADMVIVSAHKFGGPVGIGALLVREFEMLTAEGGHERGYRRGTENLPGALGMAAALEASIHPYVPSEAFEAVERFADAVRDFGGIWHADTLDVPTPYINAVAMPRMSGAAQLMRFDMAGIAVSQGSACASGSLRRSHVLEAMGMDAELADRTIRMSLGWTTTAAEIDRFAEVWLAMASGS